MFEPDNTPVTWRGFNLVLEKLPGIIREYIDKVIAERDLKIVALERQVAGIENSSTTEALKTVGAGLER
jgi:hypothetical protein